MPISALGLVAELGRLAEPALGDRPGVTIMQAHPPGRPFWHRARQPLPSLHRDLAGRVQQFGQVIDRPAQPTPPP